MVVQGTYKNGVVVLDEQVILAEGQRVRVDFSSSQAEPKEFTEQDRAELMKLVGIANSGRTDGSREHDHYIYGTPKRGALE